MSMPLASACREQEKRHSYIRILNHATCKLQTSSKLKKFWPPCRHDATPITQKLLASASASAQYAIQYCLKHFNVITPHQYWLWWFLFLHNERIPGLSLRVDHLHLFITGLLLLGCTQPRYKWGSLLTDHLAEITLDMLFGYLIMRL